jgi:hypothetical protein
MDDSKYLECIHCERFFECTVKADKAEQCVNFEERKGIKSEKRMDLLTPKDAR